MMMTKIDLHGILTIWEQFEGGPRKMCNKER